MDNNPLKKLKRKMALLFPLAFVLLAAILMACAGTVRYWQGWAFCAAIMAPALFTATYFIKKSPEFLERRMKFKEKEVRQQAIIKVADFFFLVGFLIPGIDYRYGWSVVPLWLILLSDALIIAGYYLVFLTFKNNAFAARTVEVFDGQRVIDTGPYAVVRHPMYIGIIPMFLFMPLALGSYWAMIPMIPVCAVIILRILNEEEVLKRDLPGYDAYCAKVRYRLVPFVW